MRVGIDLGTTYSAIAYVDEMTGQPVVIKNKYGEKITPSVLYFEENGNVIHGQEAKEYYEDGDPDAEAYFKYRMGNENFIVEHHGNNYDAEDLSAVFLKKLVSEAEQITGEKIDEAVITVPAYFEHPRRQATINAGKKAGLHVLSVINEPTAAVFAYGLYEKESDQTIMIYDLGGGTFDVTIAKVTKKDIKVLGSDGDHELGGRDWDDAIIDYLADSFYDEFDISLDDDLDFNNTLRVLAEKTKKALSTKKTENVKIYYGGYKGSYSISTEKFEEISAVLVQRTENIINRLFDELHIGWKNIDGVILVGGSTRMKMVQEFVEKMSGKKPYAGVDPDLAVAVGAAIRANIDTNGQAIQMGKDFFLGGSTQSTFKIAGAKSFQEATAHSLGMIVESRDRERYINNIMIRKNSAVPAEYTESYPLRVSRREEDNWLRVYMLQGENENLTYPLNATCLGKYIFTGIQYTGNTEEIVDVTYKYSEDSVVFVEAVQRGIHKKLHLSIEPVESDMSWVTMSPKVREEENRQAVPMDIVLAIDLSGSMSGKPLKKVKESSKEFIDQFDLNYTRVGILGFSDRIEIVQNMTNSEQHLYEAIDRLTIGRKLGYGNAAIPFETGKKMLDGSTGVKYLLVLTDGVWRDQRIAVNQAHDIWKNNIDIIALGFGGADQRFLKAIASKEEFAQLTNLANLTETFSGIARKM